MPHNPPHHPPTTSSTSRRALARLGAVALTAMVLVGSASGTVSAKEIGSGGGGGGGGGTTTCNPVRSLGYKGDATTSDTGVGSITISYGVKACTKGQAVIVDVKLYESADPAAVAYADPTAPASGRFTVSGVRTNHSYTAKVTVYDAATGASAGSATIFAAAVRKTGV